MSGLELHTHLSDHHHIDPLYGITAFPDVLILHLDEQAEAVLKALANKPTNTRPVTLAISSCGDNTQLMRLAMQAGVRDFYPYPVPEREIADTLRHIAREQSAKSANNDTQLTVMLNAKNGSGASTLACNVAHILATQANTKVSLLDLDMQFGTQILNFDLHPQQGFFEALPLIETLDVVALNTFLTAHKSGVHLLAALPDQIALPGEVPIKQFKQLLELLRNGYDHILIDLPRMIDPLMNSAIDSADKIVICVQQNVANLRDAQRLLRVLKQDMDVSDDRILIAVNRYQNNLQIQLGDIEQTLQIPNLICIPNDFIRVSHSLNLGVPLLESAPGTHVSQALMKLTNTIAGIKEPEKKLSLRDWFTRISKQEK